MSPLNGVHRQFVRAAMQAPFLSREEELSLALRWRDQKDRKALERIAHAHMRLVIALAARYRNYGLAMSDIIQEGHIGLMEAAARFEPDREVRFSTYASWWIRASIQDFILRNWSIVRGGTSSAQKALFFNLNRLRLKIQRRIAEGENLDLHGEIAATLGVAVRDVQAMEARLTGADLSLNAPLTDDEAAAGQRQDFLVCDAPLQDERVGEEIDSERRRQWLNTALATLSAREVQIVKARRLSDEAATLETLGAAMGVSKERVRQIEARAMEKLRAALLRLNPGMQA